MRAQFCARFVDLRLWAAGFMRAQFCARFCRPTDVGGRILKGTILCLLLNYVCRRWIHRGTMLCPFCRPTGVGGRILQGADFLTGAFQRLRLTCVCRRPVGKASVGEVICQVCVCVCVFFSNVFCCFGTRVRARGHVHACARACVLVFSKCGWLSMLVD